MALAQAAERAETDLLFARTRRARDPDRTRAADFHAALDGDAIALEAAEHGDSFRGRAERDDPLGVFRGLHAEERDLREHALHERPREPIARERAR